MAAQYQAKSPTALSDASLPLADEDLILVAQGNVIKRAPKSEISERYVGTSASSVAIGTGNKTFVTQPQLAYVAGGRLRAVSAANGANFVEGRITSYIDGTLTISVSAGDTGGSGTYSSWRLMVAGERGLSGNGSGDMAKTDNLLGLADYSAARTNLGLGNAATRAVGVAAGTVMAGDDIRLPRPQTLDDLEAGGLFYGTHRGNALTYPEMTLEAYRASLAAGAPWVDVDVQTLMDGVLVCMHDGTLDPRTTSTGNVNTVSSGQWKRIVFDASNWLAGGWPDTTGLFFEELLREFGNKVVIGVEAKSAGQGALIVAMLQKYGIRKDMVLVESFQTAELTAALAAGYPTMVLLNAYAGSPTPAALKATGYRWAGALGASTANLDALRAVGLKVASDAINTRYDASIQAGHVDAIISDDSFYLAGTKRLTSDPFATQTWYHGHQASSVNGGNLGRGFFYTPNLWGMPLNGSNTWGGSLMGWANPLLGLSSFAGTITFSVKYESRFANDRFWWMAIGVDDRPFVTDSPPSITCNQFFCRATGDMAISKNAGGVGGTTLATATSPAIADGTTVPFKITVSPTSLKLERTDTGHSCTSTDTTTRGAYLHAGVKGIFGKYSGITIAP
jgi:glycerophosphoryl diester phosphodiesterase